MRCPISKQQILKEYMRIMEEHLKHPLKFEDEKEMFEYQRETLGYFIMIKTIIEEYYR